MVKFSTGLFLLPLLFCSFGFNDEIQFITLTASRKYLMVKFRFFFLVGLILISKCLAAQETQAIKDPNPIYRGAVELFEQEQFALAYPIFQTLSQQKINSIDNQVNGLNDDIQSRLTICRLRLIQPLAEQQALDLLLRVKSKYLKELLSYHLAHFYYQNDQFEKAIEIYKNADLQQLSNTQIADTKFELAYALFNQKQFREAKDFFLEICQLQGNKHQKQAHYYYGFISYFNKDYNNAFQAFNKVVEEQAYKNIVPYYLCEILYAKGNKALAMAYGDSLLISNPELYYLSELQLLVGQLYFEKQNYTRAQELLEQYVNASSSVSKEVQYELSYCYYINKNTSKAIEGFKMLSNEKDSMGQSSMYLLGSLYLSVEDKSSARSAFQFCASNSSDKTQQRISRFNYAKLSYELGFQDAALVELKSYLVDYPSSELDVEAKELLVALLAKTNNCYEGLQTYQTISNPSVAMQKVYPKLLYGMAIQLISDQQYAKADEYLTKARNAAYAESVYAYASFWKGEIAYRQKKYREAVEFLYNFLQKNPFPQGEVNIQNARYILGYSLFQLEEYKNALAQFEAVTKTVDKNANAFQQDVYVRSADCYYMMKDYVKSLSMFEQLINNNSQQADYALFQKAMIIGIKNSTQKINLLKSLSSSYPNSNLKINAELEIAATFIAERSFGDAIPYLESIVANESAVRYRPAALYKLGLSYYNLNNNAKAIKYYNSLIGNYPQSEETQDALATVKDIFVEEGKPDEYIELLKANSINMGKNEADSLTYAVAIKKYDAEEYEAATRYFENYLSKYINGIYELDAKYYNATAYVKLKNTAKAVKYLTDVHLSGISAFYEDATIELARLFYFELKNYDSAKKYFKILYKTAANNEIQSEALRGLVRSYYQLKDYATADTAARELLSRKGISQDDKSIAQLVLGKSQQAASDCDAAIVTYTAISKVNKSVWGAEARYETAACYFLSGQLEQSEKAALAVIKETGAYDYWVEKSYLMLGDIFMLQKDYFNAKATFESVFKNSAIEELKIEAREKYESALAEEKKSNSKNKKS